MVDNRILNMCFLALCGCNVYKRPQLLIPYAFNSPSCVIKILVISGILINLACYLSTSKIIPSNKIVCARFSKHQPQKCQQILWKHRSTAFTVIIYDPTVHI